jgi:hypothetical protein
MQTLKGLGVHLVIGRGVKGCPIHIAIDFVRGRSKRIRGKGCVDVHLVAIIRLIPE